MKTLADELMDHPFFEGLPVEYIELIAQCGQNVVYKTGSVIAEEGAEANEFYVLRQGRVGLQLHSVPDVTALVQTLGSGEILGWSWLFPPYKWTLEAKALKEVHAIKIDGACIRGKCDADYRMGYELMKRFSLIFARRLEAARLQILDLYGRAEHP